MTNFKNKRAAIMSRVSSDEQALGYSLGIQAADLKKYCEKNCKIVRTKFN
mgnify:CR=1 FL=1